MNSTKVDPLLSKAEIACLQSMLGKRGHRISSAMLTVYEESIWMLSPAVISLLDDSFFVVLKAGEVLTQVDNTQVAIASRPMFYTRNREPSMPVIHSGNKHIASGSDIDLGLLK